ncbi:hypothetical protein ABZP36_016668 [Zizania latifolia]
MDWGSRGGLPSGHFWYVKNVKPGLPLFLFNYSDRQLHGIFEAACPGQLEIDRFAWSTDGSTTKFPAQVRFSTKTQCLPLPENRYESVISKNYYSSHKPGHFYFELDHRQTRDLISLFVPAPVRAPQNKSSLSGPPATVHTVSNKWSRPLPFLTAKTHLVSDQVKTEHDDTLPNLEVGYANANRASTCNLDEDPSDYDDLVDDSTKEDTESVNDDEHAKMAVLRKLQELSLLRQKETSSSKDVLVSASSQCIHQDTRFSATLPKDSSNATSQCDAPAVKDNTSSVQFHGNTELLQIINELSKKNEEMEKKQIETERRVHQLECQFEKLQLEHNSLAPLLGVTHNTVEGPSILLIGGHNSITWLSSLDSYCPALDILEPLRPMSSARAYAAVATLKDHVFVFGGGNGSNSFCNTVECYNRGGNNWMALPCLNHEKGSLAGATLNDKIFAIGGGDESQSFSEVEMFDPAVGKWLYSLSMQQPRFTPAAAELNGVLYVVGGYDGNIYLQSAERFDPREGFWTQLPSMRTRRGSHSLVALGDSLYTLGGQDGNSTFSNVEIFDTHANSWRTSTPFSVPRSYGCGIALNGNVYLLGGVQSRGEFVETVEVYNEGHGWSVSGSRAVGKRAFASAVVV